MVKLVITNAVCGSIESFHREKWNQLQVLRFSCFMKLRRSGTKKLVAGEFISIVERPPPSQLIHVIWLESKAQNVLLGCSDKVAVATISNADWLNPPHLLLSGPPKSETTNLKLLGKFLAGSTVDNTFPIPRFVQDLW